VHTTETKITFSYSDVAPLCATLSRRLEPLRPALIVAVVRGGLVPGVHLSHALDCALATVTWQTRDGADKQVSQQVMDAIATNQPVVFVDDINDSGKTFNQLQQCYGRRHNVSYVSLIEKAVTRCPSDVTALTLIDERWIVFPWEAQRS
jgi:uncharacterized protein